MVDAPTRVGEHAARLAYDTGFLEYDFGPQHPLRPERVTLGLELLQAAGLWDPVSETLTPPAASRRDLELVHDSTYIDAVEAAGRGQLDLRDRAHFAMAAGDNPAFPNMHAAAALVTGGTVEAARQIMGGRLIHAFNPAGGLHHALADRASGFCIYNDPAVAAAVVVQDFGGRVLYLDFDCHHGDGVQWLFYDSPDVLTLSFHESGRFLFPGTGDVSEIGRGRGRGYSLNVPFAPFTQDDSWLEAMHLLVPAVADRFRPDIIISSHGADTHVWDPLTHLALTTRSFFEQAHLVHELAHRYCNGRWIAVGSGGYDWRRVVPRSWAILWAEMTGRSLGDRLPDAWLRRWARQAGDPLPETYLDIPAISSSIGRRAEIDRVNQETVQAVKDLVSMSRATL